MIDALVLKGFGLLTGLEDDELGKIAELCSERAVSEGQIIFQEGKIAKNLHLCRTCSVDIVVWIREPWNKNVTIQRVEAGELFGWSAVVAPYTHNASAECVESGEEILIKGSELLELFDQNPRIGVVVLKNLTTDISGRLTQTRKKLSIEWLSDYRYQSK